MERADIKRVLKEMGVEESLTEMPAVVEPIYREMMDKSENDLRNKGKINVDEQGNFSFGDRRIILSDSCAQITFGDAKITTNSAGIEVQYEDGSWIDFFSHNSRENGVIKNTSGNNGNASYYASICLDNGSWSIRSANGIQIGEEFSSHYNSANEYVPVKGSVEEVLTEFDSTSSSVIANYPKTAEWYNAKREEVKAVAEKELDPEEQSRRRIEFLEEKVANLEKRNKELAISLSESTARLGKAIGFITQVKESPFGPLLFRKGLKKYEEESKNLPSGKEERQ